MARGKPLSQSQLDPVYAVCNETSEFGKIWLAGMILSEATGIPDVIARSIIERLHARSKDLKWNPIEAMLLLNEDALECNKKITREQLQQVIDYARIGYVKVDSKPLTRKRKAAHVSAAPQNTLW